MKWSANDLTRRYSRGNRAMTRHPKDTATVLQVPKKAGCTRSWGVSSLPRVSGEAQRNTFLIGCVIPETGGLASMQQRRSTVLLDAANGTLHAGLLCVIVCYHQLERVFSSVWLIAYLSNTRIVRRVLRHVLKETCQWFNNRSSGVNGIYDCAEF